ncbi:hypothetical protein [Undibacterium sp.]|uniref:hypothetical protein n=1 Tax=Undibacterium sp. TaxID=1914977 RepID=UPI0037532EE2
MRVGFQKINAELQNIRASFNNRGAWATGTAYAVRDYFTNGGLYYTVGIAHTSGVFATDLAAGRFAQADVVALEARLSAPGGAALIGTPFGNVQQRLDRKTYVNDFFLAAEADATSMLQRAFDSGNKVIYFDPRVTYTISGKVDVPKKVHIKGNFSQVLTAGNHAAFNFAGGGSCKELKVKRTTGAAYVAGSSAFICSGVRNVGAAPTYVTSPNFVDNEIEGFGEYGIYLAYCKGGSTYRNQINGVGYAGIGGVSCEDHEAYGNIIYDIVQGSPGGDAYGIFFDRLNGSSELEDPRSFRVKITSNTIKNIRVAAGTNGHAIDTHGGVGISISHNIITNCQGGIYLTASSISGQQALAPIRCSVTDNIIDSSGGYSSYAILVYGARNGGVIAQFAEDCTVSGNTVNGHGQRNTATVAAMSMSVTKALRVSGGTFRKSGGSCIRLDESNIGFLIRGLTMIDPISDTYSAASCILVGASDNRGVIGENTYVFEDGSAAAHVAINAIRVDSALTGLDIEFTKSNFQGLSATRLQASFLTTSGVRYEGLDQRSGSGTITLAAGTSSAFADFTFDKRMPYSPKIKFNLLFPHLAGGVSPVLSSRDSVDSFAPTPTGFRVYATSCTGSNFTASGDVKFEWVAK